ncbi:ethylene receptor 2 [Dorcoceras hygrometricum]|uniref:Ethylene receptor 2 n=1 Tax=Dorcoceras hygrometricum TaxID=472368 RepID=A0A2Z7D4A3_9LAMI|nr:ethylene receptor 2 [Dorcoceras hygrometricum]
MGCASPVRLPSFYFRCAEVVPLQIIEPTEAAPTEQPPFAPKRKIQKKKRRLVLGSDDETVEQPAAEVATVADVANAGISTADVVDIIIRQVLAETAQIGPDEEEQDFGGLDVVGTAVSESGVGEQAAPRVDELEKWFNLSYEEFHSRDADQPVVTASDTDEEMETVEFGTCVEEQQLQIFDAADSRTDATADYTVTELVEEMEMAAVEQSADEAMSLEEILMTIPVEFPLPSASGEITKITLGKSISIPGVHEGDWYKTSLTKIPATDKGKALFMERDPINGNPVKEQLSLIIADIEVLVQLLEHIIDDVDRLFNSFSLKNLAALQTDDISAKEELVLSSAEAESTRVDLHRKTYILTKYRELFIRKFLDAHRTNFVPEDGASAVDLKILDKMSSLHLFLVEELKMEVQHTVLSGTGRVALKFLKVAHEIELSLPLLLLFHVQSFAISAVEGQRVQILFDQRSFSSSSSDDSSMNFVADDIQLEDDSAPDQFILNSSATAISASIAALRESFSNLVANQSRDSRKTNNALSEVMCKIDHVERVFLDSLAEQNETFRGLFKRSLQEAQNDNNALSLALKAVQSQNVILSTDLEATRKEVKNLKAALSKDFDDKLADIRNELVEFRVETHGQLASLGTHLAELIAFLTKGSDDKNGEDSSSQRPQPPSDDQSRPSGGSGGSGNRADEQSRPVGSGTRESGSRGESQRRGDNSGSSKRRRSSGESPVRGIRYGPYPPGAPPKRSAKYWMTGEKDF